MIKFERALVVSFLLLFFLCGETRAIAEGSGKKQMVLGKMNSGSSQKEHGIVKQCEMKGVKECKDEGEKSEVDDNVLDTDYIYTNSINDP